MKEWVRMLWCRVLGIPGAPVQSRQSTTEIRASALLAHQKRALDELNRELRLYEIEADRQRPSC